MQIAKFKMQNQRREEDSNFYTLQFSFCNAPKADGIMGVSRVQKPGAGIPVGRRASES